MSYPRNYNEKILIERLVKGDEDAFKQLFERYFEPLVLFAASICKSQEIAEEMVQEVFIKVWQNRHAVNPDLSFKAYLYKITKNQVINFVRRAAFEERVKRELWLRMEQGHNPTEDGIFSSEYHEQITHALQRLSPQKQLIFRLSRWEGKSHQEIATQLGLSRSTVKNHIVETLNFVRNYLQTHSDISFQSLLVLLFV